jgi:hypothetical protein
MCGLCTGEAIQSIHRIGYDEPEECSTPCAMELPWNIATIPFAVYACKELQHLDAGQAFVLYRQFLQVPTLARHACLIPAHS